MLRWPAAASRLRVAGSSGFAPCALSHWISLRPVIARSRPVSLGGGGRFEGLLVLQIVTDIVCIGQSQKVESSQKKSRNSESRKLKSNNQDRKREEKQKFGKQKAEIGQIKRGNAAQ